MADEAKRFNRELPADVHLYAVVEDRIGGGRSGGVQHQGAQAELLTRHGDDTGTPCRERNLLESHGRYKGHIPKLGVIVAVEFRFAQIHCVEFSKRQTQFLAEELRESRISQPRSPLVYSWKQGGRVDRN